jgi:hypothetical protein
MRDMTINNEKLENIKNETKNIELLMDIEDFNSYYNNDDDFKCFIRNYLLKEKSNFAPINLDLLDEITKLKSIKESAKLEFLKKIEELYFTNNMNLILKQETVDELKNIILKIAKSQDQQSNLLSSRDLKSSQYFIQKTGDDSFFDSTIIEKEEIKKSSHNLSIDNEKESNKIKQNLLNILHDKLSQFYDDIFRIINIGIKAGVIENRTFDVIKKDYFNNKDSFNTEEFVDFYRVNRIVPDIELEKFVKNEDIIVDQEKEVIPDVDLNNIIEEMEEEEEFDKIDEEIDQIDLEIF